MRRRHSFESPAPPRPFLVRLERRYESLTVAGAGPIRWTLVGGCYYLGIRNGWGKSGHEMLVWLLLATVFAGLVYFWDNWN